MEFHYNKVKSASKSEPGRSAIERINFLQSLVAGRPVIPNPINIAGFIFDLDGTLVDSKLNFKAMRREMGFPDNAPILEEITRLDPARAQLCTQILDRHELEGAQRAALIPGAFDFLRRLDDLGIRRALVTRNSRGITELTLQRFGLDFDCLITREDGPPKPDPWAIQSICQGWNLDPNRVVMLGDFRYDIEAGRAAGARTVYFTRGRLKQPGMEIADYHLESFERAEQLLSALGLI